MTRASLVIAFAACTAFVCPAQPTGGDVPDGVHFEVMPYLIAPGMSGTATVKGNQQSINASAGDIFGHLQFGFMGRTRLSFNRWFLGTDTTYMGLGGANSLVDAGFDQWGAEMLSGYRVHKNINLLGGARYNGMSANLRFKGPQGANLRAAHVWWDPFFGGEGALALNQKFNVSARLDLGGFGAGSRIEVNSEPLVHYQLSKRYTTSMGWKFFYVDYVNKVRAFEYDVLSQGPVFGLTVRW